MVDGSITFSTKLDNKQLQKDITNTTKKIENMEQKLAQKEADRLPIVEQLKEANREAGEAYASVERLQKALAASQSVTAIDGAGTANPEIYIKELERQAQIKAELTEQERLLREKEKIAERLSAQDDRAVKAIQAQAAELDREKAKAGELAQQMQAANGASAKMEQAVDRAGNYMERFTNRVKELASGVFVFTLITTGLRKMRDWMGNVIATNDEARAAVARLKGALLTLAQPLMNVVIPAFITLVNILTRLVWAIAKVLSVLFGTTAEKSAKAAKSLYDEKKALEGVGSAAKEATGSLAGFDEINTIQTENTAGGGGGGAASSAMAPDFSGLIGVELDRITAIVAGALLAVGAILAFSGINVLLGISLMAIGALALAGVVMENWGAISEKLRGPLGGLLALLSGCLLVIGAILAFSNVNIPLGIALMAAGAVGLAMVVAANWNSMAEALQGPIGVITKLLSIALLVVGAILAFSGVNILLGVALVAAGAVGLAATRSVDWETMQNALKGPLGVITALVGAALLALGAVLLFTGSAIPLGLGLLIAGAVSLAPSIAANWNLILEKLKGPIGAITALVSASLLVLGIILMFTPVGIPLGLGLILAGAVGLATTIAPNWGFIVEKIKEIWRNVASFWNTYIAPGLKAAGEFIGGIFGGIWGFIKGVINTILGGIEGLVNGVINGINFVVNALNKLKFSVPDWVPGLGGKSLGFNLTPLKNVSIPRLATGAVIPPNREFLAVLGDQRSGTNIEAPLATIKQALVEAMQEIGGTGGNRPIQVNIMLDKKVLARAMVSEVNDMTRQAGKPVLLL